MKIQVTGDGHNIVIPVPTGLIFNRVSVSLWLKIIRKQSKDSARYIPEYAEEKADAFFAKIPDEALYALCAEIMRIKRKRGSWKLVEVESAGGEKVLITL